ncbi:MAG TPA: hypothetical protein V6D00_05510 [Pantanalinema sp.]
MQRKNVRRQVLGLAKIGCYVAAAIQFLFNLLPFATHLYSWLRLGDTSLTKTQLLLGGGMSAAQAMLAASVYLLIGMALGVILEMAQEMDLIA